MSHHGPEYFLKEEIKKHLATLHRDGAVMELPHPYVFMYVPSGYGRQTLDFLVAARKIVMVDGREQRAETATFLAIEAKAPGKRPTARQEACMREIEEAGGVAIWCDSVDSYLMSMYVRGFIPIPRGPSPALPQPKPRGKAAMILE